MPTVHPSPAGGYRFITHQFQYSGGVAAEPGFRIERARFARPVPLAEGFDAIEAYLGGMDGRRPPSAPASCGPRRNSPTPGSSGSIGIMSSGWPPGGFSATRSTRLPARMSARKSTRPPRPRYTPSATLCRAKTARRSFVAAGSGEAREGGSSYEGRIIRRGDQSPEAMHEKARFVLGAMEQRMAALGFGWAEVTATQVYTVFDIHPFLADEIVRRGTTPGGLTWHFAPAGARPRFRDGCTRYRPRIRDLTRGPRLDDRP